MTLHSEILEVVSALWYNTSVVQALFWTITKSKI